MFSQDRDSMRLFFLQAWRKARSGEPLEPLESRIAEVVREHPEYHTTLAAPEAALGRDYLPEDGETNPFLHLSLHIAILEQVGTDRPAGVRGLYQRLVTTAGDSHEAEHRIMDCLARFLWESQRTGLPPDERAYVECLERLAGTKKSRKNV
jgi:hypothetical protein